MTTTGGGSDAPKPATGGFVFETPTASTDLFIVSGRIRVEDITSPLNEVAKVRERAWV